MALKSYCYLATTCKILKVSGATFVPVKLSLTSKNAHGLTYWFACVFRSGTVPTPLVVGLGAACAIAKEEMDYDHKHVTRLSNKLVQVQTIIIPRPVIYKRGFESLFIVTGYLLIKLYSFIY